MITLKNVNKVYDENKENQVYALKDINLTLNETGLVFILGKSGGGKSSLLNIIGCLDKASSGQILFHGQDIANFSDADFDKFRGEYLGFIFQEFHIIGEYSIHKNLSIALEIQDKIVSKAAINDALDKVGLTGFANRKAKNMSGGQKQRVAVARALIKDSKVILADEPTGALDYDTGKDIFEMLESISKNKLVIVVSHDGVAAKKYADRIIKINDGRIIEDYENNKLLEEVEIITEEIDESILKQVSKEFKNGKNVSIIKKRPVNKYVNNENENSQLNLTRTKLSLKNIIRLTLYNIKQRFIRVIVSIFIASLSLAMIGASSLFASVSTDKMLIDGMEQKNLNYLNFAKNRVEKDNFYEEYYSARINTHDYHYLRNEGIDFLNKYDYILPTNFADYKSNIMIDNNVRGFIECEDNNLLGLKMLAGHMPTNKNEVAITSYLFEAYKKFGLRTSLEGSIHQPGNNYEINNYDDIIGKTMAIGANYLEQINLKITGIIDVKIDEYNDLMNFKGTTVSQNIKKYVKEFSIEKENCFNYLYVANDFYQDYFFNSNILIYRDYLEVNTEKVEFRYANKLKDATNEIFDYAISYQDDYNIEDNHDASEVVISLKTLITEYEEYLDIYDINWTNETWSNIITLTNNFSFLSNVTLNLNLTNKYNPNKSFTNKEYKVVGVFSERSENYIFMSDYESCYFAYSNNVIAVNANSNNARAKILKSLKTLTYNDGDDKYVFKDDTVYSRDIRTIGTILFIASNFFPAIAVILGVFSILLTYNIISTSIEERKKDIGILRSFGASKRDSGQIFIFEGLFIAFWNLIISSIAVFACYIMLNKVLYVELGGSSYVPKIMDYNIGIIAIMAGISIISVLLSSFIPLRKLFKKQPVDLIR